MEKVSSTKKEDLKCLRGQILAIFRLFLPIWIILRTKNVFSSVESLSWVCLWPHGLQHARPLCPSPTPKACSNSSPSSKGCHPTISSSVVSFSCLKCFPALGSFLMSQFFISGGQSIGSSDAASVLPMNIQDWFPLGWTGWISLQSKGFSRVFFNIPQFKSISTSVLSFLYSPTLISIHDHWKNHHLD